MNPDVPVSELCALIKACGESGVTELSFGTLRVQFTPVTMREQSQPVDYQTEGALPINPVVSESDEKEAIADSELRLREEQLAKMLLEDPVQFEKLLAAGELEE